ncbi:MAG TPA: hypothetical protein VLI40_07405 [Gemmatimonadaceae bacterium]|nr:hypothetical protein [Gemmatimonadaceae bacterium]
MNETIRQTLIASRRPPEPPLDAMWAQIEARVFDDAAPRLVLHVNRSRWLTPTLAAAAALVLGVGLGWYAAPRNVVTRIVASPVSASAATSAVPVATPTAPTQRTASAETNPPSPVDANSMAVALHSHATEPERDTRSVAATFSPDPVAARLASQFNDAGSGSDMSRYLAQTAVLLASLPSDRAATESDTAVAARAGELLTQTHLLLDSKAGSDPTLHRLLEDLELVLAQVARLRGQRNGTDLQLIHQTLTAHDVLPRVHDATIEASITD